MNHSTILIIKLNLAITGLNMCTCFLRLDSGGFMITQVWWAPNTSSTKYQPAAGYQPRSYQWPTASQTHNNQWSRLSKHNQPIKPHIHNTQPQNSTTQPNHSPNPTTTTTHPTFHPTNQTTPPNHLRKVPSDPQKVLKKTTQNIKYLKMLLTQ